MGYVHFQIGICEVTGPANGCFLAEFWDCGLASEVPVFEMEVP